MEDIRFQIEDAKSDEILPLCISVSSVVQALDLFLRSLAASSTANSNLKFPI